MNDIVTIQAIVMLVFGILQIILFFKLWVMTNDVKEIKSRHNTKNKFMKAVLLDDKEQIKKAVCDSFVKEVLSLSDITDEEYRKVFQDIVKRHKVQLDKYNIESPDFSLYSEKWKVKSSL